MPFQPVQFPSQSDDPLGIARGVGDFVDVYFKKNQENFEKAQAAKATQLSIMDMAMKNAPTMDAQAAIWDNIVHIAFDGKKPPKNFVNPADAVRHLAETHVDTRTGAAPVAPTWKNMQTLDPGDTANPNTSVATPVANDKRQGDIPLIDLAQFRKTKEEQDQLDKQKQLYDYQHGILTKDKNNDLLAKQNIDPDSIFFNKDTGKWAQRIYNPNTGATDIQAMPDGFVPKSYMEQAAKQALGNAERKKAEGFAKSYYDQENLDGPSWESLDDETQRPYITRGETLVRTSFESTKELADARRKVQEGIVKGTNPPSLNQQSTDADRDRQALLNAQNNLLTNRKEYGAAVKKFNAAYQKIMGLAKQEQAMKDAAIDPSNIANDPGYRDLTEKITNARSELEAARADITDKVDIINQSADNIKQAFPKLKINKTDIIDPREQADYDAAVERIPAMFRDQLVPGIPKPKTLNIVDSVEMDPEAAQGGGLPADISKGMTAQIVDRAYIKKNQIHSAMPLSQLQGAAQQQKKTVQQVLDDYNKKNGTNITFILDDVSH